MALVSIYSPRVRQHAERFGITELQAYRNLNAVAALAERARDARR